MSVENNYSLYVHINKINGKRYYGITSQKPRARWRNGKGYKNHKNSKKDTYFYNAINKYGWDNFTHEVLFDNLTKEEACLLEQCYITLYDTTNRNKGYNRTTGGENFNHTEESKRKMSERQQGENNSFYGKHHTEETKQKIKEKNSGKKHPMYGKHHTEESKEKLRKINLGKHHTEESKKKMRENNKSRMPEVKKKISENNSRYWKGKKGILSPNYGKTFTEDHKRKISESLKGKNNPSSRAVYVIELDMDFDTLRECAEYLDCTSANILNTLKGKARTAKGYHVIYAEDKTNESKIREIMYNPKAVYIVELDMIFDNATRCSEYLNCSKNIISKVLHNKKEDYNGYHIIYYKDKL